VECFVARQLHTTGEPFDYGEDIVLPPLPSMPEDDVITVHWALSLPPDTVAFIEREAQRRTDERRRVDPDSTDIITVERLASQFLYGGALLAFLEVSENMSEEEMDRQLLTIRKGKNDAHEQLPESSTP
jgi:hypothetical protein